MNKIDNLVIALKDLKQVFDSSGVEFWLIYGALLGFVRNGEMISWDNDIDIGIWETDIKKVYENKDEFEKQGFKIHFTESMHITFNRDNIYISAMVYKKDSFFAYRFSFTMIRGMDLSSKRSRNLTGITRTFKYLRWILSKPEFVGDSPKFISNNIQNKILSISNLIPNKIRKILRRTIEIIMESGCPFFIERIPQEYFTDLGTLDFYGINLNIPKESNKYLKWQYGNDWKVPNKSRETRSKSYAWKIEKYNPMWKSLV